MLVLNAIVRPTRRLRLATELDELRAKGVIAAYNYFDTQVHAGEEGRLDPRCKFEAIILDDANAEYVMKKTVRSCQSHNADDGWFWLTPGSHPTQIKTGEPLTAAPAEAAE